MPKVNHDKVTKKIKPEWLKIRLHNEDGYAQVTQIVQQHGLHTICGSGMCPNRAECWSRRTATFMIMGEVCTRSCKFCATMTGKPLPLDQSEPNRVARSINLMGLKHAVITSVTRDDLPDGGAHHWAEVVRAVREQNPQTTIEVLIPDFDGRSELLDVIIASGADIIGHNVETVRRLTPDVRSRAKYDTSLGVLRYIAQNGGRAKSGIMIGLGETDDEVIETLRDLVGVDCRLATIGQYLQPTLKHLEVDQYVTPEKFEWYKEQAMAMGFDYVASGPLVRSSYMAEQALEHISKK